MARLAVLLLLACLAPASRGQAMTSSDLETEVGVLQEALGEGRGGLTPASAVRLTFHDCTGGCDGCLGLAADPGRDNAGLQGATRELTGLYNEQDLQRFMSRADYWALAGMVGAKMAAARGPDCQGGSCLSLTFRTGRADCGPDYDVNLGRTFPDNHGDLSATLEFFRNEFNFDERQTVAIMGAHTLGRARRRNSGFDGPWVRNERSLDNEYYRVLNRDWQQRVLSRDRDGQPRFQWENGRQMMLNPDMSLQKNIDVDETGESSCRVNSRSCSDSLTTQSITREYSQDNEQWLDDFGAAFQLMADHVDDSDGLQEVGEIPTIGGVQGGRAPRPGPGGGPPRDGPPRGGPRDGPPRDGSRGGRRGGPPRGASGGGRRGEPRDGPQGGRRGGPRGGRGRDMDLGAAGSRNPQPRRPEAPPAEPGLDRQEGEAVGQGAGDPGRSRPAPSQDAQPRNSGRTRMGDVDPEPEGPRGGQARGPAPPVQGQGSEPGDGREGDIGVGGEAGTDPQPRGPAPPQGGQRRQPGGERRGGNMDPAMAGSRGDQPMGPTPPRGGPKGGERGGRRGDRG